MRPHAQRSTVNLPRTVTLRLALPSDATIMATMSRELIEAGLAWRYTPARMSELIHDPETVALVAWDSARIHGFAVMQFGDTRAHLVLLCVRPEQQRRGIGRGLNEWLMASARVAGITSIELELRANNTTAWMFYARLGFEETQQIPGYYGGQIAARRMSLRLA